MKKLFGLAIAGGCFAAGFFLGGKMLVGMINEYKNGMDRNYTNMAVLNQWLSFLYGGGKVSQFFKDHGYNRIMVYGYGHAGKRLCQALEGTGIEVVAIMDKAAPEAESGKVIGVDSDIPEVDCIVVTPAFYYDEICAFIRSKSEIPIVSMDKLIGKWES